MVVDRCGFIRSPISNSSAVPPLFPKPKTQERAVWHGTHECVAHASLRIATRDTRAPHFERRDVPSWRPPSLAPSAPTPTSAPRVGAVWDGEGGPRGWGARGG